MNTDRSNTIKSYAFLDIAVIFTSFLIAYYIRFKSMIFPVVWALPLKQYLYSLVYIIPIYVILYYTFNLYVSNRFSGRREEIANIIKANIVGMLAFILLLYITRENNYSRLMLFIFFVLNVSLETISRNIIRHISKQIRINGRNQRNILLVGYGRAMEEYVDRVVAHPEWGYKILGILDDNAEVGKEYKGISVLGTIDNLFILLPQNKYDEIVITLSIEEYKKLSHIVYLCEKSGVHTQFIPDYNNVIPTRPYTEDLFGLPIINIRRVPLNDPFRSFFKRLFDIIGSLFAIILFSPIMLIVAILIKITSPGPILYKQTRVGLHNKNFDMYKFRSMKVQDESEEKKKWTTKDDPRVTKIGKFIRKTSLDETPQFFNILTGDMSLIGPRPERPQFVEKFKEEIPRYMIKHQVRPGLTGWAQVNGLRGDTSIRKRIDFDLYYIENWTFGFDLKIMFLTAFKGFVNKNAY